MTILQDFTQHLEYNSLDLINISNSIFRDIQSRSDGAAIYGINCNDSILYNLTFFGLISENFGGAVAWVRSDDGTVSGCSFVNNSAHDGGAIDWCLNDGGTVIGCSFVNTSADYAAAIIWDRNTKGTISGCIFVNNSADTGIVYFYNMANSGHDFAINNNSSAV